MPDLDNYICKNLCAVFVPYVENKTIDECYALLLKGELPHSKDNCVTWLANNGNCPFEHIFKRKGE